MSADTDRIRKVDWDRPEEMYLMTNITDDVRDISPRPIGSGGRSDIYTAMWDSPGGSMKVAIKVIRVAPGVQGVPPSLRRSISVWKRLLHPNIHFLCGFFEGIGPAPALVSPWYENGDIGQYVQRHVMDPSSEILRLRLLAGVMTGLEFLHEHDIVHGNIKGSNVLISPSGVARLTDFGLTRILAEHSQSVTDSELRGAVRWMAPELILVQGAQHSYASDIWACGCLFIEVWSNERPYQTMKTDMQVVLALSRHEVPSRPHDMPDILWTAVQECCNFDAAHRPRPSHVTAHIGHHLTMYRLYAMMSFGRPSDAAASDLTEEIGAALRGLPSFYTLGDADLAIKITRSFALQSLSTTDGSVSLRGTILRWCLAEIGLDTLVHSYGVELPNADDHDVLAMDLVEGFRMPSSTSNSSCQPVRIASPIVETRELHHTMGHALGLNEEGRAAGDEELYEPAKLRPFARLLEQGRPGLAQRLMIRFATPALRSPLELTARPVCVAWLPDGNRTVVGCSDGAIHIIDVATGAIVHRVVGHMDEIQHVAVSPNGKLIASSSLDKSVRLWDASSGIAIGAPMLGHAGWVNSVAFSPDGRHIASGSSDATIRIWDVETLETVLGPLHGHGDSVLSVAYSPDGASVVSGSQDETVRVWDSRSGSQRLTLHGHAHHVVSVAYACDGLRVASGSVDRTIRIWDAPTGQLACAPLQGHTNSVRSVAYSPSGSRIASGSNDCTVRVWAAETGDSIYALQGHTDSVTSVAFSLSGTQLASCSCDNSVRVWDATDDWTRWDI